MIDLSKVPFVQATHYQPADGNTRHIYWIVIHTAECSWDEGAAMAVADYFHDTDTVASAHYCVDDKQVVKCVRERDIAWGAPGANSIGLHIEHAGYAHYSALDWEGTYPKSMLSLSAQVSRQLAGVYKVPLQWLTVDDVRTVGKHGFVTHATISEAFHGTHTDPGAGFPLDYYMGLVRSAK